MTASSPASHDAPVPAHDVDTAAVRAYLLDLQRRIVAGLEAADGTPFLADPWTREPGGRLGGDGLSRLVEEGGLLEQRPLGLPRERQP